MDFSIILACDSANGIGKSFTDSEGVIKSCVPWKISEDMKFFKDLTSTRSTIKINDESNDNSDTQSKTNAIIMGRLTADTFPTPLPNRLNVVITSKDSYRADQGFVSFKTFDESLHALKKRGDIDKVFMIGGAVLAEEAIKHRRLRNVYITMIYQDYDCDIKLSDTFLEELKKPHRFHLTERNGRTANCKVLAKGVDLDFLKYSYTNREEVEYLDLLEDILTKGEYRDTRNAKTYSVFSKKLEFDTANGFPLLTTKKMFYRGIIEELLFFLRGDTDTKLLEDAGVNIWRYGTYVRLSMETFRC
jgi:dihydrofolate reductase/thymidylate synthase